jgi:hypothetical protein
MEKEDLVKLLIGKDKEIANLKHIIDVIDGCETAMHLTGDPNEYLTEEKPVIYNNPQGVPVPEPF